MDEFTDGKPKGKKKAKPKEDFFATPSTLAWLARVGAHQTSLRKFAIGEGGYKGFSARAKISADGELTWDNDEIAPTPEEKEAIEGEVKQAIKDGKFPKSISAGPAEAKHHISSLDGDCFLFLDPISGEVLYVEQRIERADGKKSVLPWSYWNDAKWRNTEPDGPLPVYGQEQAKIVHTVFLHEGAKAARDVQALIDQAGASHPWIEDLKHTAHLGWPGGTGRVRDVDWEPIKKMSDKRLIVVCDNDQKGIEAARIISSILKMPMQIIRFGDAFRDGFDLGDDFKLEKKLWEEKKGRLTWVGPSFDDCLSPATWATEKGEPEGKGRPPVFLRDEFAKEWMFSVKPLAFVNRRTLRRYAKDEFDVLVAPFSDAKDVAERLHKRLASSAETLVYEPGKASGLIPTDRGVGINLYRPSEIKPVSGDLGPWNEFMEHLIPNEEDRKQLRRWIATLVARPRIKMHYSVLLISEEQGIGKTTLAEKIVMPLVGKSNCSFPTSHEATNPQFTSWLLFKRLAIIGEIYDGESSKAYNRLKGAITDDWVRAAEKYEKPFDVRNWIHILGSSNSFKALKISSNDRRWFLPEVTEEKWPPEKWTEFNTWLSDGGREAICHWAHEFVKQEGNAVQPGAEAPKSDAKKKSVVAAMSDGQRLVLDLGSRLAATGEKHVIRLDKIRTWLAEKKSTDQRYGESGSKFLETAETIAKTLKDAGLKACKKKFFFAGERFRIMANFEVNEKEEWAKLHEITPKEAYELTKEKEDEDPF